MKILATLLILLTANFSFAEGENCGLRTNALETHISNITSSMTGISRVLCEQEMRAFSAGSSDRETVMSVCNSTRNVVHFNRNNTMLPVDITAQTPAGKVGRSMGIAMTREGTSQVVQVCEGVYLAAAHGILDSPAAAAAHNNGEGRPMRKLSEQRVELFSYPLSDETFMDVAGGTNFISPLVTSGSEWNDESTSISTDEAKWDNPQNDFVFIKVAEPNYPNDYLQPMTGNRSDIINASEVDGTVSYRHFRGQSRFRENEDGSPDNNLAHMASSWSEQQAVYTQPYEVQEKCVVSTASNNMLGSDCPTEAGATGSALVAIVDEQPYLVATANNEIVHDGGLVNNYSPRNSNQFLQSEHFCEYYETACPSKKCADFKEIVPQSEQSASLRDI